MGHNLKQNQTVRKYQISQLFNLACALYYVDFFIKKIRHFQMVILKGIVFFFSKLFPDVLYFSYLYIMR